jgi:hypothetical protein
VTPPPPQRLNSSTVAASEPSSPTKTSLESHRIRTE